jgi:EAL domain-containing protein (putative c-di-GMP-specific phosphodiesterase class I)
VPPVTVNVSGKQFAAQHITNTVVSALEESGLDARYIGLELTESAIMDHAERNI